MDGSLATGRYLLWNWNWLLFTAHVWHFCHTWNGRDVCAWLHWPANMCRGSGLISRKQMFATVRPIGLFSSLHACAALGSSSGTTLHRPLGNPPPSPLVSLAVNIASSLLAIYLLWRRPAVVVSGGAILPSSAPAALVQFTTPSFEA